MKIFICTFKGILSKAHSTLFWHQVITKQIHVIMWLMPLYKWPQSKTSAISHVWALAVAGLLVMSCPSSSTGVLLIWNSSHVTNTSSFPQNTLFKKSVKGTVLLWKLGEIRYLWFSFLSIIDFKMYTLMNGCNIFSIILVMEWYIQIHGRHLYQLLYTSQVKV